MKKMNATLAWKGRKLMCNGVCVATVFQSPFGSWRLRGGQNANGAPLFYVERKTEASAIRAVNRRFGLKVQP